MKELVVNNYPKSSITEAIKTIKTNLTFSTLNNNLKTILVTSSTIGEGKSFISANLAISFANSDKKVLLIDCDLRKGRQQQIFELVMEEEKGLSNLLIDNSWKKNLKNYLYPTEIKNLDILTTGTISPNPSVLLESPKLEKILEELKEKYDIIIFDTPPVTGFSDPLILSRLADIVLIVAKAKKITIEMLENTKKSLEMVNATIGGVILNKVDSNNSNLYEKNYYDNE